MDDHEHEAPVMDQVEAVAEVAPHSEALLAALDRFAHELIDLVHTTPADQRHAAVLAKLNSFTGA